MPALALNQNTEKNELTITEINLTSDQRGSNKFPIWLTTDDKIIYVHDGEVWIMNSDGSSKHRLLNGEYRTHYPISLSPDGRYLALATWSEKRYVLVIWDMLNSNRDKIIVPHEDELSIVPAGPQVWSPDGRLLLACIGKNIQLSICPELWAIDTAEGVPHVLIAKNILLGASWLSENKILFSIDIIYVSSMQGKVTPVLSQGKRPSPSPNAEYIAYTKRQDGAIWMTRLSDNRTIKVSKGPNDWFPSWSPDGNKIAFIRGEAISDIIVSVFTVEKHIEEDKNAIMLNCTMVIIVIIMVTVFAVLLLSRKKQGGTS